MLNKKQLENFLDGSIKDHKLFLEGRYKGFYLVVNQNRNTSIQYFTVCAYSEADPGNVLLAQQLEKLKSENKQIKGIEVKPYYFTVNMTVSTANKFVSLVNEQMGKIFNFLVLNQYESGCSECGRNENMGLYYIEGTRKWLCGECATAIESDLAENAFEKQKEHSNLLRGCVGAFLGALAGVILYVLVYKLGYITALTGIVMAVLGFYLYEKFGGCVDGKGIVACIAIFAVMVFFANKLAWTWDIYSVYKDYDYSFSDCFIYLNEIIDFHEISSYYTKDLLMAYLFTALGSVGHIISAARTSKGKYNMEKIETSK